MRDWPTVASCYAEADAARRAIASEPAQPPEPETDEAA